MTALRNGSGPPRAFHVILGWAMHAVIEVITYTLLRRDYHGRAIHAQAYAPAR